MAVQRKQLTFVYVIDSAPLLTRFLSFCSRPFVSISLSLEKAPTPFGVVRLTDDLLPCGFAFLFFVFVLFFVEFVLANRFRWAPEPSL